MKECFDTTTLEESDFLVSFAKKTIDVKPCRLKKSLVTNQCTKRNSHVRPFFEVIQEY